MELAFKASLRLSNLQKDLTFYPFSSKLHQYLNIKDEVAMPNNKTVWSSEHGDLREKSQKTADAKSLSPQQQTIYLHRESSGRRGNVVTLVKNLVLLAEDLKSLAKKLKQECGTGGTIKNGVIEMQGEQREKIADILRKMGYKVKMAGG